jgi:antitoxin component YwqK of YwqJK toxin-antitoxin module
MSTIRRVVFAGLSGLMLLGASIPRAATPEGALILEGTDAELAMENGVLMRSGVPVTATLTERYESGALKRTEEWVDGRRDGRSVSWYESGQVNEERTYAAGRKQGRHLGWYADGTRRFDDVFELGLLRGQALEWYPDGTPYRDFTYDAGQESGRQRMWNVDGSLRANYVVREGRRFGLLGSKGCTGELVDTAGDTR